MQKNSAFTIYNASAGSGKTFILVKEYLKILLASDSLYVFKNILAVTFTNKAVAEMKDRIIKMLKAFSEENILKAPIPMFEAIGVELNMTPKILHEKSGKLLNTIIHNYAAFDISTIDGFMHRLIRTFAYDLKLPLNFEVELDQDALLQEAVDRLIDRAGTDTELTQVLVDFAIEKADADKSWDVAFDFNKIAKLLVNENHIPFVETLGDKSLADFKTLKKQLKTEVLDLEKNIIENAKAVLNLIETSGLQHRDFSRSTLPNHFKKVIDLQLDKLYDNKLEEQITERIGIYNKTTDPSIANQIDALLPEIEIHYKTIKIKVFHLKFISAIHKNITPLSVLNVLKSELDNLKADQNKMLISEFNTIISQEIKNQPTPFIYERIGEKYHHYFIDEFQDTSVKQWENLMPLLDNTLSKAGGSALLVGDAKQAIYRWRGGKAEQFIDLFNANSKPFQVNQSVENLPNNYRSLKDVVHFNNGFFQFLATQVFNNTTHELLYKSAQQNSIKNDTGYVELSFLDIESGDDRDAVFCEAVLTTIETCLKNKFQLKDICILVRKKKEGVALANYLSTNQVPIVSSETLLIINSKAVNFVNNVLTLLMQPKNNDVKIAVLSYLANTFPIKSKHDYFAEHINLPISELFRSFEAFSVFITPNNLLQLPLYDLVETIVRSFNVVKTSDAYIQFYLDAVLDFSHKKGSDISGFLTYFEKNKNHLSIVSPEGLNAVKIMTIHKSKGLEFPVVICPYADLDIYRTLEPQAWFSLNSNNYNGFSHALLNINKDFEYFGEQGQRIYEKHQSNLELDNINLLYVALTRSVEQLFIISKKDISAKGMVNQNRYSGLLITYLQHLGIWNDSQLKYSFGSLKRATVNSEILESPITQQQFISTPKHHHNIKVVTKSGFLWDTAREDAIEKGNLIHNIMSQIKTKADVELVIKDFINTGTINLEQASNLKHMVFQIVQHPKLSDYYTLKNTIYNERDIITKDGMILRPDRIVVNSNNDLVIIDYKTGVEDKHHRQQLQLYEAVLNDMSFKVKNKILVYINNDIKVKDV